MEILDILPIMNYEDNETGCCPRFHPDDWDNKVFNLDNYKFVKSTSKSIFHIPVNLSKVMTETMNSISNANVEDKDRYLILSQDKSMWSTDHYFLISKEAPSLDVVSLKGNYITKVYEGPYSNFPKWMADFDDYLQAEGYFSKEFYAFYTTCPKCAKHYGANYVVLFALI